MNTTVVSLGIYEVLNVAKEFQMWELSCKLLDIGIKRETNDDDVFVTEELTHLLIKFLGILETNVID